MKVNLGRETVKREKRSNHQAPLTVPENSEISVFERHLERAMAGKKKPRILIIGSSPELRNLAARNRVKTTVLANDLEVIERTSKMVKGKNEHEQWLEGSIHTVPFGRGTFDLVFSDCIVSNVPPFNRDAFYTAVRNVLKKGGFAVMRSIVFRKTEKHFEKRISRHFRIVEKEFGKDGVFSEHFPIYVMKPK